MPGLVDCGVVLRTAFFGQCLFYVVFVFVFCNNSIVEYNAKFGVLPLVEIDHVTR